MSIQLRAHYALSLAAAVAIAATPITAQAVVFRTVVLTGEEVPGTDSGVVFDRVYSPKINSAGEIVFSAVIVGSGIDMTNDRGLWFEAGGAIKSVVREGDRAPGTGDGVRYERITEHVYNQDGHLTFNAYLSGPGVNSTNAEGIWLKCDGPAGLVIRTGDRAPGTEEGVAYQRLSSLHLNNSGQVAFAGSLTGPGIVGANNHGIWLQDDGVLQQVVRTGDAAPGTEPGTVFDRLNFLGMTSTGRVAFEGGLIGPDVIRPNDGGIWIDGEMGSQLIVREGDPAPDTKAGVTFTGIALSVNGAGQPALTSFLSGTDAVYDEGIWTERDASMRLVARTGEQAPGLEENVAFGRFSLVLINSTGQLAFWSTLTGPGVDSTNDTAFWQATDGVARLVVRAGDPIPNMAEGTVLGGFFDIPIVNGAGQIAFDGHVTGPGIDPSNPPSGIWVTSPTGDPMLIIRDGDLFDVNDDPLIEDLRTIKYTSLSAGGYTGDDGRSNVFNDAGQLVFELRFTDGSHGIFVATIPEPAGAALLAIGGLALFRRRR